MPIISLDNVSYSYDKVHNAVSGVNFTAEKGEYIAVIGHNGSGKSTLTKLLNGLLIPTEGTATVDGFSSADKKSLFEIRKRVGVVFQNPDNQLVASIVEDDVAFGAENIGLSREEIGKRIDFALDTVNMQKFRYSTPTKLSGGQKQRIAIAGVLAIMPKVLVMDESTAMLDPIGREEVLSVVKRLNKEQGVTVINITHYMDEVVSADKVFVINNGEIAMSGSPKEIFSKKDQLAECGLELPLASVLAERLREKGVKISKEILTDLQLSEELCALK
jgi:energy-coupling factor transporter ATPase